MAQTAAKTANHGLATRPMMPGFAVEILGLNLPVASSAELEAFEAVCRTNPVVVVRDQTLTAAQLVSVSDRLGKVSAQHRAGSHPEFPGSPFSQTRRSMAA